MTVQMISILLDKFSARVMNESARGPLARMASVTL
jgi:hypothetical protein